MTLVCSFEIYSFHCIGEGEKAGCLPLLFTKDPDKLVELPVKHLIQPAFGNVPAGFVIIVQRITKRFVVC